MTEPVGCVICPALYPDRKPRLPTTPPACEGCRGRVASALVEISELYEELPDQLAPGQSQGQRVSGSREAPLPLRVDPLDLTMPARLASVTDQMIAQYEIVSRKVEVYPPKVDPAAAEYVTETVVMRQRQPIVVDGRPRLGPSGDQVGQLSVASRLDSWVQDWRGSIRVGDVNPQPTVYVLAKWLGIWLHEALDHHSAIDEFAGDMTRLASTLRRICGRTPAQPELKVGVPCRNCDRVTLYRWPGSDYIECMSCPLLMSAEEYERWTQLISMPAHRVWVKAVVAPQREAVSES